MRVALVTQWYPPEAGALVPRAIAEGLAGLGHDVHVLTGVPNYPTGRVYPGYRVAPYRHEVRDGVEVHRAPLYPDHSSSAVRRMVNYLSFAAGASLVSVRHLPAPDVWLTYSSPATAAVPAMLPRRARAPHALVVQDLWPDSVLDSDMASGGAARLLARPLDAFSRATYRSADAVGIISPGMRDVLVGRGVDPEAVHDTPNWVPDLLVARGADGPPRETLGLPADGVVFLYAGNLGEMQDLVALVESFDAVRGAHLVLMGDGAARAEVVEAARTRPHVHVLDPVPVEQVGAYQRAADVLVVSLRDTPLLRVTMPSKLQSSLAAGRPVLVHGAGDVAAVVDHARCGATGRPGTAEAAAAASHLVDVGPAARSVMGERARQRYASHFSPEQGARRVHDLLAAAVARHGHR